MGPVHLVKARDHAALPPLTGQHVQLTVMITMITKPGAFTTTKVRRLKILNQKASRFSRGFVLTTFRGQCPWLTLELKPD